MSEGRHRPGPWSYGHLGTDALGIGPDHNQTPVAHVDHDTEYARDNSRANARLIGAAPEMLKVLQGFVAKIDPAILVEHDLSMSPLADDLRAALSVIAKIEGRS